jgi:RNA polymerase sigma-70 factor, ECF subfamily
VTEDFSAVVSKNLRMFRSKAYQILRNWEDAEDAVQDAVLTAYKSLPRFRSDSKMSTWLMRCVINSSFMKLRRQCGPVISEADMNAMSGSEPSQEWKCILAERHANALRAVNDLSPALKRTVELRDFRELKYREISDLTGLAVGTLRSNHSRAMQQLRAVL